MLRWLRLHGGGGRKEEERDGKSEYSFYCYQAGTRHVRDERDASSSIDNGGERKGEERNRGAICQICWYRDCPAHCFHG